MLVQLFRRGPGTPGIFRKPALQRSAKQIRALLDEGTYFFFIVFNPKKLICKYLVKDKLKRYLMERYIYRKRIHIKKFHYSNFIILIISYLGLNDKYGKSEAFAFTYQQIRIKAFLVYKKIAMILVRPTYCYLNFKSYLKPKQPQRAIVSITHD